MRMEADAAARPVKTAAQEVQERDNMVEKERCTGCGACAAVCPHGAIALRSDGDGFLYPQIRAALCTECGLCDRTCPLMEEPPPFEGEPLCFGAKAKEERVRLLGSSGGIFPLLAANVLRSGGTVWGAALLEDGTVRHTEIQTEADISRISRTKYVQSDLSRVWEQIEGQLRERRPVLFCGTPCQADALRVFLGENRKGLLLVDLICYGVPSPGIWKRYITYLERRYGGSFRSFFFRDKRNRDNGHTRAVQVGESEYTCSLDGDQYCRTFFRNVNIRPSCFRCRYCTADRSSDITLGDFWGIEQVHPGFDNDGLGCSAVVCHTPKGKQLWEQIRPETDWFACDWEAVANDRQPRLREPVKEHPRRQLYLRLRHILPFSLWLRLFR